METENQVSEVQEQKLPETEEELVTDDQVQDFLKSGREEQEEVKEPPKPETKVETKKEEPKEDKKVPLAALHEERSKRKELQQKVELMERRFQEIVQNLQPKKEEPTDPVERVTAETQEIKQELNAYKQRQQQEQVKNVLISRYYASAEKFAKENQDFVDAYNYLVSQRTAEYEAMGFTPEQIREFVVNDELAIVSKAVNDELEPAEVVYKIAKARGYAKKDTKEKTAEKLETVEKGVKASKSLSSVSGASSKGLTLEALADMPEHEFKKLSYDEIARAMGG